VASHHIGFQVESLDAIAERLAAAGSERRDDVNEALGVGQARQRYANVEVKYRGPDGVMLDVRRRAGSAPDLQPLTISCNMALGY